VPDKQGRTQRPAGVAGCGLHPDIFEFGFPGNPSVADAVERYAAGQNQIFHAGLPIYVPHHSQHDFFGDSLNRGGDVHILLIERGFRPAGRKTKQGLEFGTDHNGLMTI